MIDEVELNIAPKQKNTAARNPTVAAASVNASCSLMAGGSGDHAFAMPNVELNGLRKRAL